MGVTGAQATVDPAALEAAVRDVLNLTAPRHMVVLEPIKLTIKNFTHEEDTLTVLDFPNEPERGSHKIKFCETVYIEASDFKEVCGIFLFLLEIFYAYKLHLILYVFVDRGKGF